MKLYLRGFSYRLLACPRNADEYQRGSFGDVRIIVQKGLSDALGSVTNDICTPGNSFRISIGLTYDVELIDKAYVFFFR